MYNIYKMDELFKKGINIHTFNYPSMNSMLDLPEHDITVSRIYARKSFRKHISDNNLTINPEENFNGINIILIIM